jgi:AraC-like DNA-binding protein
MVEWSTETVQSRDRFSYWREAVCQSIFNISIEAPPGPFAARLASRAAGPLRLAIGESTTYDLVRTRREVSSAPADNYSIYLQLRGETVITQGDETFTFAPNDIGLSDLRQPFRAAVAGGGRRITTVIPRDLIDRRAPWLKRKPALNYLAAGAPYVDLARRHIVALAENPAIDESAASLLAENLCNLLALASAVDVPASSLQPELQIEAMLAFCRRHLHDPALAPQMAADALGISVRTLHLRFKRTGKSFGRFVLEERLKACAQALRDPNQQRGSVSEIAYRWGFNDLSHFNRSFRAHFAMTPREWRRGDGVVNAS